MIAGSTWLQAIVHLILHTDDIHHGAMSIPIYKATHFLEMITRPGQQPDYAAIDNLPSPRFIRTHLMHKFMHNALSKKSPKIIVILRNPKDTLVSFYHFYRMFVVLGYYKGSWQQFFEMMKNGDTVFGDWCDHMLGWWSLKGQTNVIFVKYEELKSNVEKVILKLAIFLSKEITPEEIKKIAEMTSFKEMKSRPETNMKNLPGLDENVSTFMRNGQVGDWKNYFTTAQNEYFDQVYKERLKKAGLDFVYDL